MEQCQRCGIGGLGQGLKLSTLLTAFFCDENQEWKTGIPFGRKIVKGEWLDEDLQEVFNPNPSFHTFDSLVLCKDCRSHFKKAIHIWFREGTPKLDPCPFCDDYANILIDKEGGYRVVCMGCKARTNKFDFRLDAIHAWNTRIKN